MDRPIHRRPNAVCWLAVLAVAALTPEPVRACMLPLVYLDPVGETVPTAGPIVVVAQCNTECRDAEPWLEVTADDVPVPGETSAYPSARGFYLAFQPDQPLADGGYYRVDLHGIGPEPGEYLQVMAEDLDGGAPLDLATIETELRRGAEPVGTPYCCTYGPCGSGRCFTGSERVQAVLVATMPAAAPGQGLTLLRFVPPEGKAEGKAEGEAVGKAGPFGHHAATLAFTEPDDRYCATLEALSLVDGTTAARQVCATRAAELAVGAVVDARYTPDDLRCDGLPRARRRDGFPDDQAEPLPASIREPWCAQKESECQDDECRSRLASACDVEGASDASGCAVTRGPTPHPGSRHGQGQGHALVLASVLIALHLRRRR